MGLGTENITVDPSLDYLQGTNFFSKEVCEICNAVHGEDETPMNLFSEREMNTFLKRVFNGAITIKSLAKNLYEKTAKKLMEAVSKGITVEYGKPNLTMVKYLQQNVYVFSAAKNYQQTKKITAMLTKDGKLVPWNEFKKEAGAEFKKFNENYLRAEYNSAVKQARSALQWQDIQRDVKLYPLLQYTTIGDKRVRPEHEVLNRIVRPVNDRFWDVYFPPNGWNCRCSVTQLQKGEAELTDLKDKKAPTKKEVPEIFRFNPGKEKIIFSPKHPYFDVAKEDKDLAKKNFNLPLPK